MTTKSFVSPKGVAVFPHLTVADTKFKKEGEYHVKVRYSKDDAEEYAKAEALVQEIDAFAAEYLKQTIEKEKDPKKRKAIKLCDDMPYSIDEETGDISLSFKMKASGEDSKGNKWTRRPALFGADGKPLADDVKIGGGSIIKVSYGNKPKDGPFQPFFGWFANAKVGVTVTLRMIAVQVLELRAFERDASGYGFQNEAAENSEESTEETSDEETTEEDTEASDGDF